MSSLPSAGLDLGSRTVKLVRRDPAGDFRHEVRWHAHDPLATCEELMAGLDPQAAMATGYGRTLCGSHWGCRTVTEVKAAAVGARALLPGCRTVIDIGGQDTKVIALDDQGRLARFELNDKCAAGTGRFLEVMAMALGFTLEAFARTALEAAETAPVNDMCTVFAESEVVSWVARGVPKGPLARGLHLAVARRAAALVRRVGSTGPYLLCGGVGLNPCVAALLADLLGEPVHRPAQPQTVAALGACLLAGAAEGAQP